MSRLLPMDEGTELLTTSQAAAYMRMHPQTLANMKYQGRGPDYEQDAPGTTVLYRPEALDRWLDENARERHDPEPGILYTRGRVVLRRLSND